MMGPWLNHVQGAIRLLELRDFQNLETPLGMDMFRIVRQAIVSCPDLLGAVILDVKQHHDALANMQVHRH